VTLFPAVRKCLILNGEMVSLFEKTTPAPMCGGTLVERLSVHHQIPAVEREAKMRRLCVAADWKTALNRTNNPAHTGRSFNRLYWPQCESIRSRLRFSRSCSRFRQPTGTLAGSLFDHTGGALVDVALTFAAPSFVRGNRMPRVDSSFATWRLLGAPGSASATDSAASRVGKVTDAVVHATRGAACDMPIPWPPHA